MAFILNLTWREIRSSWRRLIFFFLCIALGVGSVVYLRSMISNLTRSVGTSARELMTADIDISSTSDFSPAELGRIEAVISGSNIIDGRNEVITTTSMARAADPSNTAVKFVELKGIEGEFPLVGDFILSDGRRADAAELENGGAYAAEIVLEELNVKVGDRIKIGTAEFDIRGSFDREPGGTSGFRLGGRVFISKKAFEEAGIAQNASRVRRRILYRTTEEPTELVRRLRDALKDTTISVQTYRETQENVDRQFVRTENYLSLTGLLILVLGGVGVWNVSRAFVEQKRQTVAVLKCIGASGGRIVAVYVFQIAILGLAGSGFGVLLAQLGSWATKWRFAESLPDGMTFTVNLPAAVQGIALGLAISLLFSALPLLQIRNIKPRLLLRDDADPAVRGLDRTKWAIAVLSIAGLLGLAVWQAGSLMIGVLFLAGLAAICTALFAAAAILSRVLFAVRRAGPFTFRQAVNSLYRPGNQTAVVLLAVGLGTFVVLTVHLVQGNLVREFDLARNQTLPSLFFVDVQPSQTADLTKMIEAQAGETPQLTPTVRARIAFVNGKPIDLGNAAVRQQQGRIGREFAVTFRPHLDINETLIGGAWWNTAQPSDLPQVSVEEEMADTLKVVPGDSITFDISGRKLTVQVANIRRIDLRNTRTAFIFVFRPGVIDNAPQTFAATVIKRLGATERQRLSREAVDRFPNVQVFDVADIAASLQKIIDNFVLAITFIGGFVMLCGILILIGSVALTRSQRIYENAILKTLGMRRPAMAAILVMEYGVLGILAGTLGSAFAALLSLAAARFVLDVTWEFDIVPLAAGIVVTAAAVTCVGVAAAFDVLFKKPLSTLRSQ